MVTQKYIWIDKKFSEERQRRGNKCEYCGKKMRSNEGEFTHIAPTELSGEGRGRYERLKDIQKYPDHYRLGCLTCHGKKDREDYKGRGNPRRMSSEQASNAVKRAMRRANMGAMGGHHNLGGF